MGSDVLKHLDHVTSSGERLRAAREEKRLTVQQVQRETKIHIDIIRALEDGRIDPSMSPTYVRSFAKKYAQFLGLPVDEIVSGYVSVRKELVDTKQINMSRVLEASKNTSKDEKPSIVPKLIAAGIVMTAACIGLIVIVGAFMWIASLFKPSEAGPRPIPKRAPLAKTSIQEMAKKQAPSSSEMTAQYLGSKNMVIYLVVRAKQPVLVSAKVDGKTLFRRELKKGAQEAIKASDRIELYIAKAEAVELTLNGVRHASLPVKGPIKNLVVTKKGFERL